MPLNTATTSRLLALLASVVTCAPCRAQAPAGSEQIASAVSTIIRAVLPTEYEKREDWGKTKNVTSGVKLDGLKVSRREKERRNGVWKHYKISLADAEQPLDVRIENLRSLETGRVGCTVIVEGRVNGWAQVRHFNRGLHLGTITGEGESHVRLAIDCEVGVRMQLSPMAVVVDPVVRSSKFDLQDFRLKKLGELHGDPAKELGRGMRKIAEELLDDARLTAKLNRAIEKKREKLTLSVSN